MEILLTIMVCLTAIGVLALIFISSCVYSMTKGFWKIIKIITRWFRF